MTFAPWELPMAIRSNDIDLVKDYLERGGDSNATFAGRVLVIDGGKLLML